MLDHQDRAGRRETVTVTATKVKKTLSKEKIKAQDTAVKLVQKVKICMKKLLKSIRKWSLV